MSGLNVGSAHCDQLSLQLFISYITGAVGGADDRCSKIVRLIMAGNSITDNPVKSSTATDNSKVGYFVFYFTHLGCSKLVNITIYMEIFMACIFTLN